MLVVLHDRALPAVNTKSEIVHLHSIEGATSKLLSEPTPSRRECSPLQPITEPRAASGAHPRPKTDFGAFHNIAVYYFKEPIAIIWNNWFSIGEVDLLFGLASYLFIYYLPHSYSI